MKQYRQFKFVFVYFSFENHQFTCESEEMCFHVTPPVDYKVKAWTRIAIVYLVKQAS